MDNEEINNRGEHYSREMIEEEVVRSDGNTFSLWKVTTDGQNKLEVLRGKSENDPLHGLSSEYYTEEEVLLLGDNDWKKACIVIGNAYYNEPESMYQPFIVKIINFMKNASLSEWNDRQNISKKRLLDDEIEKLKSNNPSDDIT